MLRNYFKIAWRNLLDSKLFSIINILSLSIGLSASFVIGLMVYYEFTFDKFHEDGDKIYRITSEFSTSDGDFYNSGVSVPLADALEEQAVGVDIISKFYTCGKSTVKVENSGVVFKNPAHIIYTNEKYFEIFNYKWLAGSKTTALSNPSEVVITEKRARKYFPTLSPQEVIGQTLIYDDNSIVNVSGVVANFSNRSDLVFEEFISLKSATNSDLVQMVSDLSWDNTNSASQLFVKINKSKEGIQRLLDTISKKYGTLQIGDYTQKKRFLLQPLYDLHFNNNYDVYDYSRVRANKTVLLSLSLIALFLLLLGCANFINLSTAQANKRAKEIGIRKTLGGHKRHLIFQFLSESFILTLVAAILSILLSSVLLKVFESFIPTGVTVQLLANGEVVVLGVFLIFVVAFLAGFYPAIILSKFRPVDAIKNQYLGVSIKNVLRKYLTVFQFTIAQVFIIATIIVGKQINFLMTKDVGFKTEAIAYVKTPWKDKSRVKLLRLKDNLEKLTQIQNISLGGTPPASFSTSSSITTYLNNGTEINTPLQLLFGDENYIDLYNINLLAGRKRLNDTIREYVINETYLKLLGMDDPNEALGKMLKSNNKYGPIVGVMKDFHQHSLKNVIQPMALIGDWNRSNRSMLRFVHFSLSPKSSENWEHVISQTEKIWKDIYPDSDFRLQFMDQTIERFYQQERRMSTLLNWATGLSILISCLGLFGLVVHTVERRTKEIGIRKVLGASLMQLNALLCKEFLFLIAIAFLIALPFAWWGLEQWIQNFAFRTNIDFWDFALSGVVITVITLVIINLRTLAAAKLNPTKSLKIE